VHLDTALLSDREACGTQFMRQRMLNDLSNNPNPSLLSTVNVEPIAPIDDSTICVH
jgi:hypothetical protein